jgi:6-phosphogluconolactonase
MDIRVFSDSHEVAHEAARLIAAIIREVVTTQGRFVMAVSGGKTPWQMLKVLGMEDVPWESVYVFQVDERIAPAGHTDRNLTHLQECLLQHSPLSKDHIFGMPVELNNLDFAAASYALILSKIAGTPPVFDLVHLGLGSDGHTASLVPGDHVLDVVDHDVAITEIYQGRKRMTLTYPLLNRSRNILWVVTGAEKVDMLKRLMVVDTTIPAGRICQKAAIILADRDAFGEMSLD